MFIKSILMMLLSIFFLVLDRERDILFDSDAHSKRTASKRGHGRGRKRNVSK